MLTICTWMWGDKFNADDVAKLATGLKRGVAQPFRFVVFSDAAISGKLDILLSDHAVSAVFPIADPELTSVKGCFCRLRMFDPEWQTGHGVNEGDRIVLIDLDTIVTGPLDPLFDRPEPFVIMQGANAANPCPFNGALQMLHAGYRPDVWGDFSLEAAAKVPFYSFPDDQGWLHAKIPDAAGWKVGPERGVYVYGKPGWPGGKENTALPDGARLVTFINKHPSQFMHLDWVKDRWRA